MTGASELPADYAGQEQNVKVITLACSRVCGDDPKTAFVRHRAGKELPPLDLARPGHPCQGTASYSLQLGIFYLAGHSMFSQPW